MKRFIPTLLTALILPATFTALAAETNVSASERAKIESVVHDYLLKKPEILVEALQILQRKQYEQAELTVQQTQKIAGQFVKPLFQDSHDPIVGNAKGEVTVVEFFDYQCPHCVDMAPVMAEIIKANPNLRVVFKEFPIRGPQSQLAAKAALAANMQGKYYDFSHALLTTNQPLTEASILATAKKVGLNVDKLKTDMNSASVEAQIRSTTKLAQDLKLFGTPAFFIGKTNATPNTVISYIPGQMNAKQLQTEIDKAKK